MGDTAVSNRLYVRFPIKIRDELKIKELNPDITRVILPRQKSARWCFVEFENNEKCKSAYKSLKTTKIQGKGVVVKFQEATENKKNLRKRKDQKRDDDTSIE